MEMRFKTALYSGLFMFSVNRGRSEPPTPEAPANTVVPVIDDTSPQEGQTITGSTGTWTGYPGPDFTYQWYRDTAGNGTPVELTGETDSTLIVDADWIGDRLRVVVTGTNTEGDDTGTSDWTTAVTAIPDDVPDAFDLGDDVDDADLSTYYVSDIITVAGINVPADISVFNGDYRINAGSWVDTPGTVEVGDEVEVRVLSDAGFSTNNYVELTIGGVSDTFSVVTLAEDTTPDAFNLGDQTNAALTTQYESSEITVAGINSSATISISGGQYQINGGSWVSSAGTVVNGDDIKVRGTSSGSFNTAVNVVLTIGGVQDTFTITTILEDTTPTAFNLGDQTNAALSTQYESNEITVAGINSAAAISITGGEYQVNGGSWTSSPGTVVNGDDIKVRGTASSSFNTGVDVVLTIGGVSDTFTITTILEDTTPNAFSFTDQTDVDISTQYESNEITVAGINSTASVSITGGEYQKNGGGWTSSGGTCVNGDTFKVRGTSSGSYETAVNVVLTIGGVSDTFTMTTEEDPGGGMRPWVPSDLGGGVVVIGWEADSGVTHSSNAVSQWAPVYGTITADQSSAGAKPTYSATARNSLPGLTFDGGDYLDLSATTGLPTGNAAGGRMVVGYQTGGNGAWRAAMSHGAANGGEHRTLGINDSRRIAIDYWDTDINLDAAPVWENRDCIVYGGEGSGQVDIIQNGDETNDKIDASVGTRTTASTRGRIGANSDSSAGDLWVGVIQAVYFFSRELTKDEQQFMEGYLAHKWDQDGNLPGGHPYKSAAPEIAA